MAQHERVHSILSMLGGRCEKLFEVADRNAPTFTAMLMHGTDRSIQQGGRGLCLVPTRLRCVLIVDLVRLLRATPSTLSTFFQKNVLRPLRMWVQ